MTKALAYSTAVHYLKTVLVGFTCFSLPISLQLVLGENKLECSVTQKKINFIAWDLLESQ
jgi:hypothetical protein